MKRSVKLMMLVAIGGMTLPSTGLADKALATGKLEYEAKCAVCHGVSGRGDGPFSNQLAARSTDLTQLAENNGGEFPTAKVYMALDGRSEVQAHGPRDMPIYGEVYLTEAPQGKTAKEREPYVDTRLRALVAYLESLQSKSPLMSDQVAMGKLEYQAKCAICHGASGKGDGPFSSQLAARSTDLTQLTQKNGGEFPMAKVYMSLDGRSEVQAHGPRDMPIYGEVYLTEAPKGATAKEREPYVDERLKALVAYLKTMQK